MKPFEIDKALWNAARGLIGYSLIMSVRTLPVESQFLMNISL